MLCTYIFNYLNSIIVCNGRALGQHDHCLCGNAFIDMSAFYLSISFVPNPYHTKQTITKKSLYFYRDFFYYFVQFKNICVTCNIFLWSELSIAISANNIFLCCPIYCLCIPSFILYVLKLATFFTNLYILLTFVRFVLVLHCL